MAKILALDTSTDACSVALMIDGAATEIFKVIPRRHTHELLPMVEQILASAQLSIQQLDAIAFGRGPGSFAGIRIATGVTQGLAFATDLPVVAVSSLAAMAQGYYRNSNDSEHFIVTAFDARMDEVYWGCYAIQEGVASIDSDPLSAEVVSSPERIILSSEAVKNRNCIAVGSGFNYLQKMPTETVACFAQIDAQTHPHALDIAVIADREYALGNTLSAENAQPVYLRNQVTWKKKDQQ